MPFKLITNGMMNKVKNFTRHTCNAHDKVFSFLERVKISEHLLVSGLNLGKVTNDKGHYFFETLFVIGTFGAINLDQFVYAGFEGGFLVGKRIKLFHDMV
jgi:hypothetical protein